MVITARFYVSIWRFQVNSGRFQVISGKFWDIFVQSQVIFDGFESFLDDIQVIQVDSWSILVDFRWILVVLGHHSSISGNSAWFQVNFSSTSGQFWWFLSEVIIYIRLLCRFQVNYG